LSSVISSPATRQTPRWVPTWNVDVEDQAGRLLVGQKHHLVRVQRPAGVVARARREPARQVALAEVRDLVAQHVGADRRRLVLQVEGVTHAAPTSAPTIPPTLHRMSVTLVGRRVVNRLAVGGDRARHAADAGMVMTRDVSYVVARPRVMMILPDRTSSTI
jgi:hypothetical protein